VRIMTTKDWARMHREVISDIVAERDELQQRLNHLQGALAYHEDALKAFERHEDDVDDISESLVDEEDDDDAVVDEMPDYLRRRTHHEATAIALKDLGGTATMSEIRDWLWSRQYGRDKSKQTLYRAIAQAIKVKPQMFEKVSPGTYQLKEGVNID